MFFFDLLSQFVFNFSHQMLLVKHPQFYLFFVEHLKVHPFVVFLGGVRDLFESADHLLMMASALGLVAGRHELGHPSVET